MSLESLRDTLDRTREQELDCDTFASLLAAYLDGGLDEHAAALVEHHREVCAECDEEAEILVQALGRAG